MNHHFKNRIFSTLLFFTVLNCVNADDPFAESSRSCAIDAIDHSSKDNNWLFSPISSLSCLSMVFAGSDGRTAYELSQALHLSQSPDLVGADFHNFLHQLVHRSSGQNDYRLHIVQGIWSQIDFPFLDEYMSSMRKNFEAEIESIQFSSSAIHRINDWIADQTEQKIQNLLQPDDISPSTKLVLANAFYFKGAWIDPFQPQATNLFPFTTSQAVVKNVKMMQQTSHVQYYEDSDWQAVILPFKTDSSSIAKPACLLLLPKDAFCLTPEKLDLILSSMQHRLVHLKVPKFTFEQHFDLQGLLTHLGVSDSFSEKADFSKMDGRRDLYLSKVLQKCYFSLDEQGVEAAAATAAVMNATGCRPMDDPLLFIADRPFIFMLIDQTSKTCLMVGRVADPLQ